MSTEYFGKPQAHTSHGGGSKSWGKIEKEKEEEDDDSAKPMEIGEKKKPKGRNPVVLFRDMCADLDQSCPGAIYKGEEGMEFEIPLKNLPAAIRDKVEKVDFRIIRATCGGLDENVTNYIIGTHIIPTPIHTSPLVALIERTTKKTFTDSISSLRQLLFFYLYFYKVALDDAEYCKLCRAAYIRIKNDIDDQFFKQVDQILDGSESYSEKESAALFAVVLEQYSLQRVRAVEWTILDMLSIPPRYRSGLLTPSCLPDAPRLSKAQGSVLRKNLCHYIRKRKEILGGGLKVLDEHGLLTNGIRVNGKLIPEREIVDQNRPHFEGDEVSKMEVEQDEVVGERSYQGDVLQVLTLEADFQQPANVKFKGYVCIKTIFNYLQFLARPEI